MSILGGVSSSPSVPFADVPVSIEAGGVPMLDHADQVHADAVLIRWRGGLIRLNFHKSVCLGRTPFLTGGIAKARFEVNVGERGICLAGAPRTAAGLVRFLLDPIAYKENARTGDFAQAMFAMEAGQPLNLALLRALVGEKLCGLLVALQTGPAIEPDRHEAIIHDVLLHHQHSEKLWDWVELNHANSLVRLFLFRLRLGADEEPAVALTKLAGKRHVLERLRNFPAEWIAHIAMRMPDEPEARRPYFAELLPALKAMRHALILQPEALRVTCVSFAAFCCNWIAHYRELGREKLGVGECSALLDDAVNPRFDFAAGSEGLDTRHVIRFLRLAVDALKGVRTEDEFVKVQRATRRIARWLAGSNSRIDPELLRQARFERLLGHAELWRIELQCSSDPWYDSLPAAPDATGGAVWSMEDRRHQRSLRFFPILSELELLRTGERFRNCLVEDSLREGYRVDCMRGHSRLFRIISQTGKAVALLCLDWSLEESRWIVGECKGVANSRPVALENAIAEFVGYYNRMQPHPHGAVV